MSKNIEGKDARWSISFGFYPGILFGMRSYVEENQTAHVFYVPFLDLAIETYK